MTWKTLRTASGPATRVPQQVKAILAGDVEKRAEGVHALLTTLVQPGRWFSASAPTLDLILGSVSDASDDVPGAGRALWLALDIATAVNEDFLRGRHSWDSAPEAEDCRRLVERAHPALLSLLSHDDPAVRAPAAALLALGQGERDATARAFRARSDCERDPFALAHVLLGSGLLDLFSGKQDAEAARRFEPFAAEDHPEVVRTAAALAQLAAARELSSTAAKALPAAMHHDLTPDSVGWCDGRWPHLVAAVARRVGAHVAPLVTRALRDDLKTSTRYSTNQKTYWARVALDAAGLDVDYDPWAKTPVRDLEGFSSLQRGVVADLAPFFIAFTGTGVPQGARARLRWLGVAPPGVLEQLKEWTVDGSTVRWPVWKIWQHERLQATSPTPKGCIPPAVAATLTDSERVEALIETYDFSYGLNRLWSPDETKLVSEHLRAAADDEPLVRLVQEILESHEAEPAAEPTFSGRLLDLWLARGGEIPPAWDRYIRWQNHKQLAALPVPRREARLFAGPLEGGEAGVAAVLEVLPLVPTRAATTWVLGEINARRRVVREKNWPEKSILALLQQVIDLAETEPDVKSALEEARRRDDWVPEGAA